MSKIKISPTGRALYEALTRQEEQEAEEDRDGSLWRMVYLDNATAELDPRPDGRQLSNLFGQLTKAGLYRAQDNEFRGAWGEVRLEPTPIWEDA